jgi:carboxymethylenebutenolidase
MVLAQEGYVAFAPDLVSGGTPPDPSAARAAVAALPRDVVRSDAAAAVRWLGGARRTSGGVAILGLGWGGTVANAVAAAARQTARAGVSYYGRVPAGGDGQGGASPLLLHLAGQDRPANRATEGWARGLQRGGAEITTFYYPTARPGFATPGPAYDEAAAGLAWGRTLSFLQRQLA